MRAWDENSPSWAHRTNSSAIIASETTVISLTLAIPAGFGLAKSRSHGVAIALSTLMVPFAIIILRPAFAGVPDALEEAAAIDGAGEFRFMVTIAIPLVRNSIFVTGAIIFVAAWAELVYPLTFLLDSDNYPLSVFVARSAGRFNNTWNSLMAVSVMASLPVLEVVLSAQNQMRRGLTIGAVK